MRFAYTQLGGGQIPGAHRRAHCCPCRNLCAVEEIEGHIEEGDDLLVHLDGDAEAICLEDVRDLFPQGLILLGLQGADPQVPAQVELDQQLLLLRDPL